MCRLIDFSGEIRKFLNVGALKTLNMGIKSKELGWCFLCMVGTDMVSNLKQEVMLSEC